MFVMMLACIGCKEDSTCKPMDRAGDCVCTMEYDPVCGCDGVTYSNACEAQCHHIVQYEPGRCACEAVADPECVCPEIYDPVCGCDQKTYSNACFAECHGITDHTDGECP